LPLPARAESFASFDDFASRYRAAGTDARGGLAASFLEWQKTHGGFPIAEGDGSAVLLYFGTGREKDVRVAGDFRTRQFFSVYWDERGEQMERLAPGGALFWKRLRLEPDARLDYKFIVDGEYRLDALNPHVGGGRPVGEVTELAMPGFRQPEEILQRAEVPKGALHALDEPWAHPKVQIYLPPGYDPSRRYPVVYTADGSGWIRFAGLPTVLDNLVAGRVIRPVIAVMIDAAEDRSDWYFFNSSYLAYLERVVEYVDAHYSTLKEPAGRLHIGTSAGGRAALHVGLERPNLFSNLGLFSASLVGAPHYYEPYFTGKKRPDQRLRIWLSAGSYEGYIREDARTMEAYFRSVGVPTRAVYTHEGHNWGTWRHLTKEMLRYFFPYRD